MSASQPAQIFPSLADYLPAAATSMTALAAQIADALKAAPQNTVYSYCTQGGAPYVAATGRPAWVGGNMGPAGPYTRTDCSGWVSYLLGMVLPQAYEAVAGFRAQHFPTDPCPWPRAYIYYRYGAVGGPAFQQVAIGDLQPGDIVAYALGGYASATSFQPEKGDTGHIMLVVGTPVRMDLSKNRAAGLTGSEAWLVPVCDSSSVPHLSMGDFTDSRDYEAATECPPCGITNPDHPGGVGYGWLGIAGGNGVFDQFCFDPGSPHFNWNTVTGDTTRNNQPALIGLRPTPGFAG